MNISVFGVGRLGLCFALSLERAGFHVLGVDREPSYIRNLNDKTLKSSEREVEDRLKAAQNFRATGDVLEAFEFADVLYTFVATPSLPNHRFDHSQIERVIEKFPKTRTPKILVIGSTVMPKTSDAFAERLRDQGVSIVYSPSFIAQGEIFRGIESPDFVLIGQESDRDGDLIESVWRKIVKNAAPVHRMSRLSAEITKLALNCFITNKIAFANLIGDLAVQAGGDPTEILSAIGSDSRVGSKYFKYGFGYGGPCFPRDNRALTEFAKEMGIAPDVFKSTDLANRNHLDQQIKVFETKHPIGTRLEFGPVSYNTKSPSIEESQQLEFAVRLANRGYLITIVDRPEVIELVRSRCPGLFEYRVGDERCLKDQQLFAGRVDLLEATLSDV